MVYNGKRIEIGDSVQYIKGVNEHGESNYGHGVVKSFSGNYKTMYVHINVYSKTPKYDIVRHEEIVGVVKKERK